MVLTGSKAALAALLLVGSAISVSAQSSPFGLSFTYVSGATGLSTAAAACAQGGGNALFSPGGELALCFLSREPRSRLQPALGV